MGAVLQLCTEGIQSRNSMHVPLGSDHNHIIGILSPIGLKTSSQTREV